MTKEKKEALAQARKDLLQARRALALADWYGSVEKYVLALDDAREAEERYTELYATSKLTELYTDF